MPIIQNALNIQGKPIVLGKNAQMGFDTGRGVWPRKSFWIWGSGMKKTGTFSQPLNIGSSSYSNSEATDDAFWNQGEFIKLNSVETFWKSDKNHLILFETETFEKAGDIRLRFHIIYKDT